MEKAAVDEAKISVDKKSKRRLKGERGTGGDDNTGLVKNNIDDDVHPFTTEN